MCVINIKKNRLLPLFHVGLTFNENSQEIFMINTLLYSDVVIEKPYTKRNGSPQSHTTAVNSLGALMRRRSFNWKVHQRSQPPSYMCTMIWCPNSVIQRLYNLQKIDRIHKLTKIYRTSNSTRSHASSRIQYNDVLSIKRQHNSCPTKIQYFRFNDKNFERIQSIIKPSNLFTYRHFKQTSYNSH